MKFYSKRYFMISLTMLILFASIFCAKKEKDEKKKAIEIVRHRTLGLAYLEEDKLNEAENEFKSLIKLAPGEAMAYANLGLTYMRMAKYDEAEQQVKKALKLEPGNSDIRLILAEIYDLTNRPEQAIKILEETLKSTPDHIKSLYKLAQLYGRLSTPEALQRQLSLLKRVVELQPANIAARLQLMELLIRNGQGSEALAHLEDLIKQIPEMPKEARPYYDQAFELLHANRVEDALRPVRILHNFLKITPLYQSNIVELKGPRGSQIGFPVLTFSHEITTQIQEPRSILEAMQFTDVTASAKLDSIEFFPGKTNSQGIVAVADFDNDGDQDIYFSNWNPQTKIGHHYLLRNNLGRFSDITGNAGVTHRGKDLDAIFADYNNDGYLDLFVVNEKGNLLYNNMAEGKFADMAKKAGLNAQTSAVKALFADFDHEGDLDLFLATRSRNLFYRNNMDGTFIEMADKMGLSEPTAQSQDAIFADFDDDGDLDLFVVNEDRSNVLYSNLRGGRFKNITDEAGLSNQGHSGAVTIGDYNNDGFVDLFITGMENGQHTLYRNNGDGTFKVDRTPEELYQNLQNVIGYDTEFLDFDNDGLLDLLVVGKSKENVRAGRGIRIFHNEGGGKFKDTTNLLPDNLTSGFRLSVFDYNEDGDLDLLIAGFDGSLRLLRNDGGNANKYLKIRLVGLRSGSGKNNYFGIGSKIEVRAGDLYQMRVVTHPMTHFGLGHRLKADVVRILWPNGVPQNLFYPGSDQDLIETQTLKGSCAFLYTWNGREFQFLTDIMWRSALGMPLGIMGGETAYAFPNSSDEHLRIPGDRLKPDHGKYQLRVTEELWETAYFDKVNLITVDHPDSVEIYLDERFTPPPTPPLKIYQIGKNQKRFPLAATDDQGTNLLPLLRYKDDVYVANFKPGPYQGLTEMHDLILDLGDLSGASRILLFLQGWLFPTDASINVALAQNKRLHVIPPYLQVPDKQGTWRTVLDNMSFPMGKNKTIVVDLTDKFLTQDYRVRIRTNLQIYWDHIFFTVSESNAPVEMTTLSPAKADLHYRGFSRLYRKGGRYGPHWFDYNDVTTRPQWRDLIGNYTRYGDVTPLLLDSDDMYVILNAGDEVSLEFDATEAPDLPEGWTRDFLIYSDGWIKDGDLNTAYGKTVEPLPFHGMSRYPYGPEEGYPQDEKHKKFVKKYLTRKVTTEQFRRFLSDYFNQ